MSRTTAPNPSDRRRAPRTQCRLHGRVARGRERIRVRIVDISEGGLCLLTPLWLDPKKPVQIEIDVPGRGVSKVGVEIWHIRREKSRSSNNKIWIAGAILVDADGTYASLLEAAGLAPRTTEHREPASPIGLASAGAMAMPGATPDTPPTPSERAGTPGPANGRSAPTAPTVEPERAVEASPDSALDCADPRVFRLRCKARGTPRTRMLSIAAESADEALELARHDLGAEWTVLEALEA